MALNDTPCVGKSKRERMSSKKKKLFQTVPHPVEGAHHPQNVGLFRTYAPLPGVVGEGTEPILVNDQTIGAFGNYNLTNNPLTTLFEEGIGFPGYPYLSQLSLRGEYRLIVETRAEEATREWIELTPPKESSFDKIEQINAELRRLDVQGLLRKMLCTEGYFGLAHLYIDLETARQDEEEKAAPLYLSSKKIKKGELKGFRLINPNWVTPVAYNAQDPLSDDFYKPSLWWVLGQQIHQSRLLTLVTQPVPDLLKPAYNFGGIPFAFMCKPYVDNWLRTRQSVSDLIKSFSTMVLKTDLSQLLSPGCEELSKRAELMAAYRDNRGLQIVDKETEDLINVSVSLNGLDKLQAQSQEHMAAIAGIPLVKLLGITPSGLNASSDGEIRCFYDKISALQEAHLKPILSKILELIQLHLFSETEPTLDFYFSSLWQLDGVEQSKIRVNQSQTLGKLVQSRILSPDEARKSLTNPAHAPLLYGVDPPANARSKRSSSPSTQKKSSRSASQKTS
ncbi:hypothetical protein COMNV_01350 [Commensalibacter sp. Nvir]|uniref:DUF1073 domain-containing protein n=1 Tax=Commensalibacter sp. Nvir TaxID=3069817 RepID=UPI002D45E010|nr:hypothetical protein COMNV_01350 [Commensalibacter sp. Nvir]